MISIALPKGRLGEKVYSLFEKAGYNSPLSFSSSRQLLFENKEKDIRYFWVKPGDVPIYVERGVADIGVAGKDVLEENKRDIYELLDTKMGKCKMCVASLDTWKDRENKTLRVATKYPHIAREYYNRQGREIDIIKLTGSIEIAPLLNLSDVIVDIVETGRTLKENGLKVFNTIFDISALLICNKSSYLFQKDRILEIVSNINYVITREEEIENN